MKAEHCINNGCGMESIDFTAEEITDNKRALVMAMKLADESGDTAFADRLEKLKEKLDQVIL